MLHLSTGIGFFLIQKEIKLNLQYFERPSYIRKGDNVKIYMQMMGLEESNQLFFSKNLRSPRCKFLRNSI